MELRWYRLTPDRFVIGLLVVECIRPLLTTPSPAAHILLLLHDLGSKLADLSGATPSFGSSQLTGRYNGGSPDLFIQAPAATQRQWRTTPLWGVADSAPYMHDGRAVTLDDAIEAHGGEAAASERLYSALPSAEREKLLGFLNSLAAPQDPSRIVQD